MAGGPLVALVAPLRRVPRAPPFPIALAGLGRGAGAPLTQGPPGHRALDLPPPPTGHGKGPAAAAPGHCTERRASRRWVGFSPIASVLKPKAGDYPPWYQGGNAKTEPADNRTVCGTRGVPPPGLALL